MNKAEINFFYDKNEDWESTYNNQNFFEYNLHRMRYLVVDTELTNNPFEGCVDLETLEVKNQLSFDRLKQYTLKDLLDLCEANEWDWIGDDFEHMCEYFNFVCGHLGTHTYTTQVMNDYEYLDVEMIKIPEQYLSNPLAKRAYLEGVQDAECHN